MQILAANRRTGSRESFAILEVPRDACEALQDAREFVRLLWIVLMLLSLERGEHLESIAARTGKGVKGVRSPHPFALVK